MLVLVQLLYHVTTASQIASHQLQLQLPRELHVIYKATHFSAKRWKRIVCVFSSALFCTSLVNKEFAMRLVLVLLNLRQLITFELISHHPKLIFIKFHSRTYRNWFLMVQFLKLLKVLRQLNSSACIVGVLSTHSNARFDIHEHFKK